MFSILPSVVAALFLSYGLYVVTQKGFNRISISFFILSVTTFFWQATWAVLFQTHDPDRAMLLIRFGYVLILFLPTSLYHFLIEISGQQNEERLVYFSYACAAVLSFFTIGTDLFVRGHYDYFFGFYPKAGPLHPLHVLQTVLVVNRGLYVTWLQRREAPTAQKAKLRICIASVLIYFFAAVDYLCNYGIEFYPPGAAFVAVSLGMMAYAITKYDLMNPMTIAATVAHEMRTPLASIRMSAETMAQLLPELRKGYQLAVDAGLHTPSLDAGEVADKVDFLSHGISRQVDRSNTVINMMLASSRMEHIDTADFKSHSALACVWEAVKTYPFSKGEAGRVRVDAPCDFEFHGSDLLMVFVLFNLMKNSLYAISAAGRAGEIVIRVDGSAEVPVITFRDTGTGIASATVPKVFDAFFTTKKSGGAGIGLAFCKRVINSFGGRIACASELGSFTEFTMEFPAARRGKAGSRPLPAHEGKQSPA